MKKVKVIGVKENNFNDRYNNNEVVKMWRCTCLLDGEIIEVWSRKPVVKDDELTLVIVAGKDYKPVVRVL